MGLLDKLWDDTVAGPQPDTGLGKLRKFSTFSFRQNSSKESDVANVKSCGEDFSDEPARVTRSIMIVRPSGSPSAGSPPISPAGSTPPVSPFSGSRDFNRFRRKSLSDAYDRAGGSGIRSPRVSDPPFDV